ncbi:MAG: hypothetical protein K8S97_10025 [Anaerolineae bacterium]|nr:hypothetical protein [Anaerolineae bacterium]
MTGVLDGDYNFVMAGEEGDEFKRFLQGILNEYHTTAYPLMEVPQSQRFVIRVTDGQGDYLGLLGVGGCQSIGTEERSARARVRTAVDGYHRGQAHEEGCTRLRVETFQGEVGFYQRMGYRIVGRLEDYPEGYHYYWMRKDLLVED